MEYYRNEISTLYCGDCIETMNELIRDGVRVDKVITSPPYNVMRPRAMDIGYDLYKDNKTNDQYIEWTLDIFDCYDKILNRDGCIAYNMSYGSENTEIMLLTIAEVLKRTCFTIADILVWKKESAIPNNTSPNKMTRICEFVYVFCRRDESATFKTNKKVVSLRRDTQQFMYENVFNFFSAPNNDGANSLNKATFSTKFVENIIDRYVLKGDVVLDNFSGTGTTLVACASKGIKTIGIELSEKQCEYSANRMSGGVQCSLF